jgi:transcriptional regulator with XRE-family HTH domain
MNFKIDSFKAKIPVNSVFRCLRISAGMTTKELSRLMECSSTLITHYEMGNRVLTEKRIGQLCKVFRITREELEEYVTGKRTAPINYQDECILILSKMNSFKLQAVYGILVNMAH